MLGRWLGMSKGPSTPGRLTGAARLLAMSWPQAEFDNDLGVLIYLRKLAQSPLVRRSLPNAAAIMSQYFQFRRQPGEAITTFLVRETLGFEEFNEALVRLREERQGLTMDKQLFGLETLLKKEEETSERDKWSEQGLTMDKQLFGLETLLKKEEETSERDKWSEASWSRWRRGWYEDDEWPDSAAPEDDDAEVAAEDVPADSGSRSPTRAPPEDQGGEGQTPPEAGSTTSRRPPVRPPEKHPKGVQTDDDSFDSFILDVLRGWRLLQAASLTLEERRDVLSSTANRLDFESVSNALQILWDEQLSGVRRQGHGSHLPGGAQVFHLDETAGYEAQWQEQAGWNEDPWPEETWDETQFYGESSEPWHSEWDQMPPEPDPDIYTAAELDDPSVRDALQAERAAEAMAADAAMTWKRAQQATAAVRKDRGFGAADAFRVAQQSDQCHKCGGFGHFARDCKKRAPKGRPKGALTMEYDHDPYDMYYLGGKGKKKGKTKGHFGLGKGPMHKGKHGKNPRMFPGVNAYGLEMLGSEGDLGKGCYASQEKDAIPPSSGLLDCGATASAGPEASVQRLIASVIEQDQGATITIDQSRRPYFRYGSGAWGRALYHVTITSKVSGYEKQFGVYALPNPPEYVEPWFRPHMLVPILVGMSHIGPEGAGMIIDFNDGSFLNAADIANKRELPPEEARHLPTNSKGHYILDVASYLTGGQTCKSGHCSVVVKQPVMTVSSESEPYPLPGTDEDLPLKFMYAIEMLGAVVGEGAGPDASSEYCKTALNAMLQKRLNASSSSTDLSSSRMSGQPRPSPHFDNVALADNHGSKEVFASGVGLRTSSGPGHSGPKGLADAVAMLRRTSGALGGEQQIRPVEALRRLLLQGVLCSPGRRPRFRQQDRELPHQAQLHEDIGDVQPEGEMVKVAIVCEESVPSADSAVRSQEGCDHDAGGQGTQHINYGVDGGSTIDQSRLEERLQGEEPLRGRCPDEPEPGGHGGRTTRETISELVDNELVSDGVSRAAMKATLPKKVAAGVMAMVAVLTNTYRGELQALTTQRNQCSVWEIGCSPESMLTTACQSVGLGTLRINHVNGYDLYKEETYPALRTLFEQHRPRRIWFSPRSDRWQPWGHLNQDSWQARQNLEGRRRHERTMLRRMCSFLSWAIGRSSLLEIFWEWPTESLGWKEPALRDLEQAVWRRNKDWLACRVDGCRYGMRDGDKGPFIKKRWLIKTTCPLFHTLFKTKVCVQDHEHVEVPVMESKGRLDYPWKFVKSVAQAWRDHLFPLRHFGMPATAYNFAAEEAEDDEVPQIEPEPPDAEGNQSEEPVPTDKEIEEWERKLRRFHSAAGHPSNHQLSRIVKEAGKPKWMVEAAAKFSCPHCEAVRPGGLSSKQIPPLSTRPLPAAWQQVVADVGEWTSVAHKCKLKFVVFVDAATKLRVAEPLFRLGISEMKSETGMELVQAFSRRWLSDKPKPEIFIPDNARSFTSKHFQDFCSSVNVWLAPPAEDVKEVMEKIQLGNAALLPETCLALATGALNQTSFVKGFSSYQWAYGKQFSFTDEDEITMSQLRDDAPFSEFSRLLTLRHEAEQRAKEVRAQRVLSKLKNSITRQPLRTFQATDMVKVWRRALPLEIHKGNRGGSKKAGRYHWIGPGRVVLQETVPHQDPDDPRRHIIWVVIGGKLYRCSAHSVRPVTEQERAWHHLHTDENPSKWRSLQDVIPTKEYTDLSEQIPPGDDPNDHHPDLPAEPDDQTWVPSKRLRRKQSEQHAAAVPVPVEPVNDYADPDYVPSDAEGDELGVPGTLSEWAQDFDREMEDMERQAAAKRDSTTATSSTSVPKKARTEEHEEELTLHAALQECDCAYVMEIDLHLKSNRQMKKFLRSPSAFLVGKMRDCEVRWEQLTPEHKKLFSRAKTKEVTSFIQQEAVRKCMDAAEEDEAKESGRIMKCRWVLTWKPIPEEERDEALKEVATKGDTTIDSTATRKAKARIVLLGYQHPDLLREGFNSSAPVQSVLTRNLAYQMTVQNGWTLESLDLSTAFLQTAPKEEMRIWTQGVAELRSALGVGDDQLLRVLKDFYGSTTAPRGLWLDLHATFTKLGATKILSDPCMWIWTEPNPNPRNAMDRFRTIGMMGGHVDDFNRSGDLENPRWLEIRERIDKAYKWGTINRGSYRHAGTDIISSHHPDDGLVIEVNQDQYIEAIADFPMAAVSGRAPEDPLDDREVAKCRAALGSLQWVAVQTQPLICARCNLILSDLASRPTFALAKEIQQLTEEIRQEPMRLRFKPVKDAHHWQDIHVVTLGDQAHHNRPKGGSTGGLLTFIGGPSHSCGVPGTLVLLGWKTWKLQRVAIGSTDAEVQAMVEAEDLNFKTRLIWAELNGATVQKGHDFLKAAEEAASHVPGILGTDSKGGYDAVVPHEGPDLGLSNARAAIQGHQLKEGMRRVRTKLIWLASDFNLSVQS
ncbi:hypothetical protein AK812_SmicGene30332 [Symbiodinium microadriaticum]|uniref:Copia protein n=1 Tax=Symbiodinium microadriaticum TaxID=2951 RepID=A0A1Q9CZK6_SYMMI|nr:hypothetical protein AK812_SmicGene30332 [Symbiodinium microadriaticum]